MKVNNRVKSLSDPAAAMQKTRPESGCIARPDGLGCSRQLASGRKAEALFRVPACLLASTRAVVRPERRLRRAHAIDSPWRVETCLATRSRAKSARITEAMRNAGSSCAHPLMCPLPTQEGSKPASLCLQRIATKPELSPIIRDLARRRLGMSRIATGPLLLHGARGQRRKVLPRPVRTPAPSVSREDPAGI